MSLTTAHLYEFFYKIGKNSKETYNMLKVTLSNEAWASQQYMRDIKTVQDCGTMNMSILLAKNQHIQCLGAVWFTINTWKMTEDRNVHHLCSKLLTEILFMCHVSKKFFPLLFMMQQQQCNMSWINYCSWWDSGLWVWCRNMATVFTVEFRTIPRLKKLPLIYQIECEDHTHCFL